MVSLNICRIVRVIMVNIDICCNVMAIKNNVKMVVLKYVSTELQSDSVVMIGLC